MGMRGPPRRSGMASARGRSGQLRSNSAAHSGDPIRAGADKVKLDLAGSAFVYKDGTAISGDWYTKLENNKLIAALLGLLYAGLARWVWKVFAGE